MNMNVIAVKMNEKELVWIISSIKKYGKTSLLKELEEKMKVLQRYKYPERGKKREYQINLM